MLWRDDTGRKLEEKLESAAAYYERKYGRRPSVVMVPAGERGDLDVWKGVVIQQGAIQKDHLIVGEWI